MLFKSIMRQATPSRALCISVRGAMLRRIHKDAAGKRGREERLLRIEGHFRGSCTQPASTPPTCTRPSARCRSVLVPVPSRVMLRKACRDRTAECARSVRWGRPGQSARAPASSIERPDRACACPIPLWGNCAGCRLSVCRSLAVAQRQSRSSGRGL